MDKEKLESLQDAAQAVKAWVKDGTPSEEPVTVETPAADVTPVVEPVEKPDIEPAEVEGTVEGDATGGDETPAKFTGRVGDEDFDVPADFLVPVKRGTETEYISIKELQEQGMRQKDYTIKTTDVARQRKELDRATREAAADRATLKARENTLKDREVQLREVQNDPEKLAAYNEHMEMYSTNPEYRKTVDKSMRVDELEARQNATDAANEQAAIGEAVETIADWMIEFAGQDEYANVDPERVRVAYASAIQGGTARIDQEELKGFFDAEAASMEKLFEGSPLRRELDDLKARFAKQEEAAAAASHNAGTAHAISRAKSPAVKPITGAPAAGETQKGERFSLNELPDRQSAWIKAGKP